MTPFEVEVTVEETSTRRLSFECSGSMIFSLMLLDDGTDYRPFHPLILSIDNIEVKLPCTVETGKHTLEFLGESFSGAKLLITGINLNALMSVTIESATIEVNAQQQMYAEGPGDPSLMSSMKSKPNGFEWLDTVGKIRYKMQEGKWIQLAS
jgi:hypothetical protein